MTTTRQQKQSPLISETSTRTSVSATHIAVLDVLVKCTRRTDWEHIPAPRRSGAFALARVVAAAADTLSDPVDYCFKYLAYELLLVVLKPMVLEDGEFYLVWGKQTGRISQTSPSREWWRSAPAHCAIRRITVSNTLPMNCCW